jgi:hypothetical protein
LQGDAELFAEAFVDAPTAFAVGHSRNNALQFLQRCWVTRHGKAVADVIVCAGRPQWKKGQEQGKQAEQGGRQKHRLERAGTASGIDARPSSFDGVEPYGPARKVPAKSNPE